MNDCTNCDGLERVYAYETEGNSAGACILDRPCPVCKGGE